MINKNSKTIVMVGGGIQQVEAARIIKDNGYNLLVTDKEARAHCREYADHFSEIDGKNVIEIATFIKKVKKHFNIVGILTLTELVETVAKVARICKLPGVDPQAAFNCQNKNISSLIWSEKKISTPKGINCNTFQEGLDFFKKLNGPVFVKPIVGFGGLGSKKIENQVEFTDFFMQHDIGSYLIQEYCLGDMVDVNGFFDDESKFNLLGVFDRQFKPNSTIELSATYPSRLSSEVQREAGRITEEAARSLGISWGPIKSDLVLKDGIFKVFEVAPRLHGPKGTVYLSSLVSSKSHLSKVLPVISAQKMTEEIDSVTSVSGFRLIEPPKRPYKSIEGLNTLKKNGYQFLIFKKFSKKILKYEDSVDAIGYIFTSAKDHRELKRKLNEGLKLLAFN